MKVLVDTNVILDFFLSREAVRQLLKILGIIAVDGDDCGNALDLPVTDFEDALITVCAGKEAIDYIVSNDKEFSQIDTNLAMVVSSHDFLNRYQK